MMSDVGCLSFTAFVSLLTSAIIPLAGSLLQQKIIELNYSIAKSQTFGLY
jgi:hypothetical protein